MLESIWSFVLDFVSKPDQVLLAIIEKYHNWVYVFLFLIIFAENGGKTVILARFIPIVRTIAPFVAGAGEMKYRTYLLYCITGAFIWVSSITLLGYFLGNIEWVKLNFEKFVLGIVFISVLPIIFKAIKRK